jgi:putative NIF3 family GTP cyclohydrolase 1 type 2
MKTRFVITVFLLIANLTSCLNAQNSGNAKVQSASVVISEILKNTRTATIPNTVDVIKEGDPQTQVTGIATCMFATMDALKQAVNKNCNLIIVHEPLYYNHFDETAQLQNDPVFLEKKRFITDNKLVIFRFHDYIHTMVPDGIEAGMVNKLGWKKYLVNERPKQFIIPETDLNGLLSYLKKIFPGNSFYVVGKPEMKVSHISLAEGALGSQSHIRMLENPETDVVIAGEAQQWETYEYVRDAVEQGMNKAVVFLGHIPSEEAGMEYCAEWLKTFIPDVPVIFIKNGSSYWSY